jgi:hypothetical protein
MFGPRKVESTSGGEEPGHAIPDDTSTPVIAMSESEDQAPVEPDPYEFTATAEFRYGVFLVLLLVGLLAYGATWVPRLIKSAAPASEASVPHETSPTLVPTPEPGCHLGAGGGCDWAGLRSSQSGCHHGVGKCDWGKPTPAPPGDKVALQATPSQTTPAQSTSPQITAPPSTAPPSTAPQSTAPQSISPQTTAAPSVPSASTSPPSTAPACHNGVGTCNWGKPKSAPPGDQVASQSPPLQTSPAQPSPPQSLPPASTPAQSAAACHNGIGKCDWGSFKALPGYDQVVALRPTPRSPSPQSACREGPGTCDWAEVKPSPRCRDGAGSCVRVALHRTRRSRYYDTERYDDFEQCDRDWRQPDRMW